MLKKYVLQLSVVLLVLATLGFVLLFSIQHLEKPQCEAPSQPNSILEENESITKPTLSHRYYRLGTLEDIQIFQNLSSHFDCQEKLWCDEWYNIQDTAEIQREFYQNQNPTNCSSSKFLIFNMQNFGLGSCVHTLSLALTYAYLTNRVLMVQAGSWMYADLRICPQGNFECFFDPITYCYYKLIGNPAEVEEIQGWNEDQRVLKFRQNLPKMNYNMVPKKWRHKGSMWWKAQGAYFLMNNPRPEMWDYIHQTKKTFPNGTIPHPIISLHVRHGDKYIEAQLFSFDEHMLIAERIRKNLESIKFSFQLKILMSLRASSTIQIFNSILHQLTD